MYGSHLRKEEAFLEPLDSIILFIHEPTHFKSFSMTNILGIRFDFGGRVAIGYHLYGIILREPANFSSF